MIQRRSLVDLVCDEIRFLIATGELQPGQHLSESKLLTRLSVSRPPLREALQVLSTQRILTQIPHKGYVVTDMSRQDWDEIYAVRESLEKLGLNLLLPRLPETDFSTLESVCEQMRRHADAGDDKGVFQDIIEFHIELVGLARSRQLTNTYEFIMQHMKLYSYWGVSEAAKSRASLAADYDRHKNVLDALKTGDGDQIERAFEEHGERRHLEAVTP